MRLCHININVKLYKITSYNLVILINFILDTLRRKKNNTKDLNQKNIPAGLLVALN